MSRLRILAAIAALITVLLLQATLVAPLTLPVPISLPALLVAAVALRDGPGTGLAFGFATGLVADLASDHPAGVLALTWLAVGVVCGLAADGTSTRLDAAIAAGVCTAAALAGQFLLLLTHTGGATAGQALHDVIPTVFGDALLALAVVPLVARMLESPSLRAIRPAPPLVLESR